jgi:hypothetical protein
MSSLSPILYIDEAWGEEQLERQRYEIGGL